MAISSRAIKAGEAFVQLLLDDEEFAKGVNKARAKLDQFGRMTRVIAQGFAGLGAAITAPFALGARTMVTTVAQLDLMSIRLGIARESMASMAVMANVAGVSLEQLDIGLKTIGERIVQLRSGSGETVQAFKDLGINVDEFVKSGDNLERFLMLADGFEKITDAGLQSGLALRALGEAGNQLIPMLRLGRRRLEEYFAVFKEVRFTEEQMKAATEMRIALALLVQAFRKFVVELSTRVWPVVKPIMEGITTAFVTLADFARQNPFLVNLAAAAGTLATGLGAVFGALSAGATIGSWFLGWLKTARDSVIALTKALTGLRVASLLGISGVATFGKGLVLTLGLAAAFIRREMKALVVDWVATLDVLPEKVRDVLRDIAQFLSPSGARVIPLDFFQRLLGLTPEQQQPATAQVGDLPTQQNDYVPQNFASAGIIGSRASQQTLGFAALDMQATMETIAELTAEQNNILTDMFQIFEQDRRVQ